MTIHSLYIFNKKGSCLYYAEWYRPRSTLSATPDEDRKLMFGLVFSLKQMMNKMNPAGDPSGPGPAAAAASSGTPSSTPTPVPIAAPPPSGPDQGFFRYTASAYALHHLETTTGYRFVLTSDVACPDLRPALWHIYSELFVGYTLKNPLYTPGQPIESVAFAAEIDRFIKALGR